MQRINRLGLIGSLCFMLHVAPLCAQTTGSFSGRVVDEVSNAALPGATVQVLLGDTAYGTTTDASGAFRFTAIPTGIHRVQTRFVGYAMAEIAEVWVRSGKEENLIISLQRNTLELDRVEVRAGTPRRMEALGMHTLTVEQSLRYPATFFDPARLAMSYAGVASTNDQANHFSIRGNGPASNAWLLEGAEIVTPNHLTNAGTQSDLPTLTGGGTTILSAQMLGTSHLLMGSMAAPYGNALGGIMDLRLRPGTTQRQAFTLQAGLIGIDLSAEGPFRKGGKSSYLINYRYSTLGLLSAMGVALGDEAIAFQDLSFNINLPIKERSVLTLFGMGGNSSNRFDAKDSTEWEFEKDSQNIDYMALVGAAGITFKQGIGSRSTWSTTAVISANDQERQLEAPFSMIGGGQFIFRDTAALQEQKLSVVSAVQTRVGQRTRLVIGGSVMERSVYKDVYGVRESTSGWLLRPFVRMERSLGERVQLDLGVAYAHWTTNGSSCMEPRLALRWAAGEHDRIGFAAGQRSQLPAVQNYALFKPWFAQVPIDPTDNRSIGLLRSQDVEISYEHHFAQLLRGTLTGFVQRLQDVPVGAPFEALTNSQYYSLLNEWNGLWPLPLIAVGEGLNVGGQFSLERSMHRDLFYQVNATVFNATWTDRFGEEFNSRWNTGVIGNAILGREFVKQKESSKRTWGVNGRINYTGGQRYTPIQFTSGDLQQPYTAQYTASYRVDLRIYLKRERTGRTGMWSLDLLNALNTQNEAYRYFDGRKGEIVTKYQMGLIPNLSYRIEF